MKDLVRQHKQKGQMLEKSKNDTNKKSFFNNIVMDLEVLKYSLEQHIGFVGRLAFIHYCGLHQV